MLLVLVLTLIWFASIYGHVYFSTPQRISTEVPAGFALFIECLSAIETGSFGGFQATVSFLSVIKSYVSIDGMWHCFKMIILAIANHSSLIFVQRRSSRCPLRGLLPTCLLSPASLGSLDGVYVYPGSHSHNFEVAAEKQVLLTPVDHGCVVLWALARRSRGDSWSRNRPPHGREYLDIATSLVQRRSSRHTNDPTPRYLGVWSTIEPTSFPVGLYSSRHGGYIVLHSSGRVALSRGIPQVSVHQAYPLAISISLPTLEERSAKGVLVSCMGIQR
ncbi:hypothetical protein B0H11DRAFT_2090430 [Mycena galericulata]|nr:hypothetical protein B0H11DRAFT_2090430 [Mycena galericulata]